MDSSNSEPRRTSQADTRAARGGMFNYHRQWTINHAGFKFFKRRTNKQERAKLKEQLREPQ